jgi:DNA-binding transcriptional LysR family regulator
MEVFVEVVRKNGFARAAEALDTSPANVTRIMADLEAHLGAGLLNRSSRKMSLTESGEALALHPEVEFDVALIDRVVDIVEEGYDMAIRISRAGSTAHAVRKLATSRNICCAAPAYLAQRGTPHTPTSRITAASATAMRPPPTSGASATGAASRIRSRSAA